MNLSWSNRVIKYVLFIFNLLFVISGIIMIAVGVSVKSYYTDYDVFLNDSYFSLPNLLIATGSIIFFVSFFGCCGAIRESWFMIFIFSILLSLIFILEFSAGIAGYVLRDKTSSYLTEELRSSMSKYQFNPLNTTKVSPTTVAWDAIQENFECCGAKGPLDWGTIIPTTSVSSVTPSETPEPNPSPTPSPSPSPSPSPTTSPTTSATTSTDSTTTPSTSKTVPSGRKRRDLSLDNKDLPGSCCKSKPGATGTIVCRIDNTTSATYFKRGCVDGFGDYLKEHAVTLGGVGLAIAFIQLFGVIFACHLTKQLKHGFYST